MPLIERVAAKEKAFAEKGQWKELISYWDARDRERDRAYYKFKDSIDTTIMEKAFLEEEELMDLEKVYQICKNNVCDVGSLEFNYMNIHEIASDPNLANALKKLTEKQKFVLYLYGVEWYKTSEIAKMMNISPRGVRNHLDAAKRSIMKSLGLKQATAA